MSSEGADGLVKMQDMSAEQSGKSEIQDLRTNSISTMLSGGIDQSILKTSLDNYPPMIKIMGRNPLSVHGSVDILNQGRDFPPIDEFIPSEIDVDLHALRASRDTRMNAASVSSSMTPTRF